MDPPIYASGGHMKPSILAMEAAQPSESKRSLGLDEYESDNDEIPATMSEPSQRKRPKTREAPPRDPNTVYSWGPESFPRTQPDVQRFRTMEPDIRTATDIRYESIVRSTPLKECHNLAPLMMLRRKEGGPHGARLNSAIPPPNGENCLGKLSEELLVRIIKSLDLIQVLQCRLLNKKWRELASDGEVWRSLYFEKFVSEKETYSYDNQKSGLELSKRRIKMKQKAEEEKWAEKEMKWMDEMKKESRHKEGAISNNGQDRTNWLGKYKLRVNWEEGRAKCTTINLESPTSPAMFHLQTLSQMHKETLYTADKDHGLRAWNLFVDNTSLFTSWPEYVARLANDGKEPAQVPLHSKPSAMALDTSTGEARLAIGFEDGSWEIWCHEDQARFKIICISTKSSLGPILEIAFQGRYLTTITSHQLFLLYDIKPTKDNKAIPLQGTLLHDLTAYTAWAPYSLSIRQTPSLIIASVAYTIPTVNYWSVAIQELHFDPENGSIIDSRQASPVQPGWFQISENRAHPRNTGLSPPRLNTSAARGGNNATMTYKYPYLVVGRENNTLANYQVTSMSSGLDVVVGMDLQPRTSGVMGVDIGREDRLITVQKGGGVAVTRLQKEKGMLFKKEKIVFVDSGGRDVSEAGRNAHEGRWEKQFVKSDDHKIVVVGGGRILIYDFR